jgi:hypothetical protein
MSAPCSSSLRAMSSSLFGTGAILPQQAGHDTTIASALALASYSPFSPGELRTLLVNCRRAWPPALIYATAAGS